MRHHSGRTLSTVVVASFTILGMSSGISLGAGEGGASPANPAAVAPAKVEKIPGSDLSKVVLTPKAAERIAIKMGVVTEQPIRRWLRVAVKSRIRQRLKREVLLASVTLSRPVRPVNRAILSQVCF